MSKPADWARAYARQSDADFRSWELFEQRPETVAAACHKLLFLLLSLLWIGDSQRRACAQPLADESS
jgi:hypothetical protein